MSRLSLGSDGTTLLWTVGPSCPNTVRRHDTPAPSFGSPRRESNEIRLDRAQFFGELYSSSLKWLVD
ncbi:hypothetical protein AND_008795 [Anopheles darlingi]|uniref:Uncharacterized protein n=1 Tax=Anopheles darlingi TaxID=43151 RepID=W5J6L2_ANODA|nr:hypothetical protein AND_008795 [Anopheles darlingi]